MKIKRVKPGEYIGVRNGFVVVEIDKNIDDIRGWFKWIAVVQTRFGASTRSFHTLREAKAWATDEHRRERARAA